MNVTFNYEISYLNPKIVFVSGGPGSGKGTQCERLVRDYHFDHISVGDVVRDEIQRGTPEGQKFKEIAARGDLVPDNLVVALIIKTVKSRKSFKYLIDGFPRGLEQAKLFEKKFKEIDYILNFEVPDETLMERLLGRAATSGRSDDNAEAIANRLKVFHQKTQPVLDFYNHFGKVKTIDGTLSVDEVYKRVQDEIKPNLVFFFGPPSVGKTETARRLSEKLKYQLLNLESFDKQYNIKNETDRINKLINYLQTAPFNNFIIDDFFKSKADAEIFLKHFSQPYKLFYFDSPKDEVMNNIQRYYTDENEKKQKKEKYNQYVETRQDILNLVQNQPYFVHLNAIETIPNIIKLIMNSIRPLVAAAFTYKNMDLGLEYCDKLEKKRDFIYLDVQEQCESEIERGTNLGAKMNAFEQTGQNIPPKFKVELLQKIIFANPKQRKFVLTNFPERQPEFDHFERELFPIDYLLTFYTAKDNKVVYYPDFSPVLNYFAKGRYVHIDREALDILDAYIVDRSQYGVIIGPTASGKTTLAKYIAEKFQYTLIEWEPTFEKLKGHFGTEDNPVEEITYDHVEKYYVNFLNPTKNPPKILFDGWPSQFTFAQFQQFLNKIGLPTFAIDLTLQKNVYIRRYKMKNEMDLEAELNEEDQQKLDDFLNTASQYSSFISTLAENNFGLTLYRLDVNNSLDTTKRHLNNIFYKRVFVVNDYIEPEHKEQREEQKLMFLNYCARTNTTFVDVPELMKTNYWQKPQPLHDQTQSEYVMRWTQLEPPAPCNYSPKLVIQAIQNFLKTLKVQTRDVLLYGYPAGDTPLERTSNERYYPRASDEVMNLEKELGPIRMVSVMTHQKVQWEIQDEKWDLPPPAEKPKKKAGDDDGQEEEAPPEEEDDGKPKFNIYDYQWTKCEGLPKSLPQWYNKLKNTQKKHFSFGHHGAKEGFERLLEFYRLINEENQDNKAEQDYRKVNLFVQFRYDEVPEHEETEIEPERELYKHQVPEEPKLVLPDHDIIEPEKQENAGDEENEDE